MNFNPSWVKIHESSFTLELVIQAQAKRNLVRGVHGDRLRITVAETPQKGEANKELLKFLSRLLGLKVSDLEIVSGDFTKYKRVRVDAPWSEAFYKLLVCE